MEGKRFCIMSDDDCHQFIVAWDDRNAFRDLVEGFEETDDWWDRWYNFPKTELNKHHSFVSFTDPRVE